ncbi:MAG: hypothetical protein RLZZ200_1832 [Pseudomonadota bacterium]|jgi:hypothetical protein
MKTTSKYMAAAAALCLVLFGAQAGAVAPSTDEQAVSAQLKQQFEKPEAPLTVASVAVEGHYAVAGWMQGKQGGRALLTREQGSWALVACGGDGLVSASFLEQAGMAPAAATRFSARIRAVESKLTPTERKQLSSFDGLMRFERGAHHGMHH